MLPEMQRGDLETHIILNPAAGKGRAESRRPEISSFLETHGVTAVWHVTLGPGEAGNIARLLGKNVLVIAAGGDGTVHEVAAACAGTERILGVLPIGSGNDYVKALGIGVDLKRALETLVSGRVVLADAGEVNGVTFNNGLGIGFDAEVAAGVEKAPRYLGGFGGYLWSVGGLLRNLQCRECEIHLDNKEKIGVRTILFAAALGTTYGARFKLAPHASLDDGLFEVVWTEEVNRREVLRLIPSVLRGTHLKHPKVYSARAVEVKVVFAEEVPAHVDGELLPLAREFRARLLPKVLRVLVPDEKE